VLNLSGIDTYNTGDVDLARLYIRGIRSYKTTYYDDIWVDDAQFHGNCRIRTFYPDSDGTYSQWIRNTGSNDFEMVDERPPDGDTTYIYSVTKGHKSSFGITTGAFNEPAKGMQMIHRLRTPDTGARRVKLFVRSGAADHFAPVSKVISPSNVWYGHNQLRNGLWLNDPADDNPWTQAKLEAAEFGVQLVGPTTTTSTTSTTTTS
jgi:hypothetical protein